MSTPSVPGDRPDAAAPVTTGARAGRVVRTVTWARGQLAAWFLLSLVYLATTAVQAHAPAGGSITRVLQFAYGAGHFFALGAAVAGAVFVWRRLRPSPVAPRLFRAMEGYLVAGAVAFVIGWPLLAEDFVNLAGSAKELYMRRLLRALLVLAAAALIPLAAFTGRLLARAGLRPLAIVLGMTAASVSCFVAPQAYFGLHLYAAVIAATMIGVAITGARVALLGALVTGSPRVLGPWTIAALWGAWAILDNPPAPVLFELFRTPGAVLAPFVAPLHVRPAPIDREALQARWPALAAPPSAAPPTSPPLAPPGDAVVVLVTVDCLRADMITREEHAAALPNLVALRDQSVFFSHARTTAASTVIALSSIFTGKQYSQLTWSDRHTSRGRKPLPFEDPSVRFPELLSRAGVATVTYPPIDWLSSSGHLVQGFREEEVLSRGAEYAFSDTLVDRALRRIESHQGGPMFLFLHFLDAHAPYDLAGTEGSSFDRYLRELALIDRQIGRLAAALDTERLRGRATLIVTADHGEAFGEHHTTFHKFTTYEELVRVPLLIRAPSARPHTVSEGVSLVDIGPTVLDLFGQPTPPEHTGQSLVPALRGERPRVVRPRAIESELHQAIVFEDGFKVIRHKLRGTIELYDLTRDPDEMTNLFHERDNAATERLAILGAFFDTLPH